MVLLTSMSQPHYAPPWQFLHGPRKIRSEEGVCLPSSEACAGVGGSTSLLRATYFGSVLLGSMFRVYLEQGFEAARELSKVAPCRRLGSSMAGAILSTAVGPNKGARGTDSEDFPMFQPRCWPRRLFRGPDAIRRDVVKLHSGGANALGNFSMMVTAVVTRDT